MMKICSGNQPRSPQLTQLMGESASLHFRVSFVYGQIQGVIDSFVQIS